MTERGGLVVSVYLNFMKTPHKRWWFWIIVAVLVAWGLWQAVSYWQWWQATAPYRELNRDAAEYWAQLQSQSDALEAAYRNDPYGGETPQETLRLFVEALEDKDFELAARYFVVEEWENAERENRLGEQGGNQSFINAYRNGTLVPPGGVGASGIYEIEIFPQGEDIAYGVRMVENEFTGKWKILEL